MPLHGKMKNDMKEAVEFLNPGQIPVTAFDQPLIALVKFVQWRWPDTYGERVHVVMLGGSTHRNNPLEYTGCCFGCFWMDNGPTQAEVASSGRADSFRKATDLTRTRTPTKSLS